MAVQPPEGLLGSDRLNSSGLGSISTGYGLSTDGRVDTHGPPTPTPTCTVAATTPALRGNPFARAAGCSLPARYPPVRSTGGSCPAGGECHGN